MNIPINRSWNPPHHGAFSNIKFQLIFFCIRNEFYFLDYLKVFALSLINFVDLPFLEIKRCKANNRFFALRSEVISKFTAWLNAQVNIKI